MIADVPAEVWQAGLGGETIEAELGLRDAGGRPLCARVPADLVTWRIGGPPTS